MSSICLIRSESSGNFHLRPQVFILDDEWFFDSRNSIRISEINFLKLINSVQKTMELKAKFWKFANFMIQNWLACYQNIWRSTRSDLRPQINQLLNHSIFYSTLVVLLVYRRPMKDQCTPSYRSISPSQSMWVLRIIQSKANQNSGPGNICSSSFRNKAILHFTLFGLWSQSVYSYSKRVEYAEAWFHSRGCVEMCVNQLREREARYFGENIQSVSMML